MENSASLPHSSLLYQARSPIKVLWKTLRVYHSTFIYTSLPPVQNFPVLLRSPTAPKSFTQVENSIVRDDVYACRIFYVRKSYYLLLLINLLFLFILRNCEYFNILYSAIISLYFFVVQSKDFKYIIFYLPK